ncbi:hypothetical protein MSMAW_0035 [Methanosarcina mazei WWM610]|uniref:Uncharacterized protein n=3 Tax=Methanosarcina mazei TaxID=2209 RepID=A0A0F8Q884_METMZ|nr:hypothetical protein MSMAW_0035 [Methanosarcina mazei WWM610]AKB69921.1 hypothetical protein MSMAC_0031 [Methanosarcina mazei C16]KKH32738.1 hypothetical protein DU37_10530 [Methanosarcina mazei]KKH38851.1 hypothetical protein DU71_14235 [Methanosarcina mazei]
MLREYKPKKREDPGPYPILGFELIFSVFLSGFPVYFPVFQPFLPFSFSYPLLFLQGFTFSFCFLFYREGS